MAPDLVLCVAVAVAAAVLAGTGAPVGLIRAVAVPALLVVPGHALVRALRADDRLGTGGRALLAVATSTCCTGLGGLLLAETVGVSVRAWTLSLVVLTVSAVVADTVVHAVSAQPPRRPQRRVTVGLLVLVGAAAASGLAEVAVRAALPAQRAPFVQLSALPGPAGSSAVTVRVANPDVTTRTVVLVVRAGGSPVDDELELQPGQTWSRSYPVTGTARSVEASVSGVSAQPVVRVDVTPLPAPDPSSAPPSGAPTATVTPTSRPAPGVVASKAPTAPSTSPPRVPPTSTRPLLTVLPVAPLPPPPIALTGATAATVPAPRR